MSYASLQNTLHVLMPSSLNRRPIIMTCLARLSYFEEAAVKNIVLKDEIGTVFGSYGWSGEAPKLVIEIPKSRFGVKFTNYRSWSNVHQINLVSRRMLRWVIELPKALFIESDMC